MLCALLYVVLLLLAYSPLLRTGLFPGDYATLLREDARAPWGWLVGLLGLPAPGARTWQWRVLALIPVGLCALALRAALARALAPRVGGHVARSAGLVAALLLPLHPGMPDVLVELTALPELLGIALGLTSLALFLLGRQEGRDAWTTAALLVLALAGAFSSAALLFVPVLGAAEFGSVRRHRPRGLRVRTTLTTMVLFGVAAALPVLLAGTAGGPVEVPGARERLIGWLAQLGRAAIPSAGASGAAMTFASGALLLLALQPAFHAARNAPRLWSSILIAWTCTLVGVLLWAGRERGAGALPVVVVWCVGLGLTITASTRPRRALLGGAVLVGWAALTHAGGRPALRHSRALARWYDEVAALEPRYAGRVLFVDPPLVPTGSARDALGWLFHPALDVRHAGDSAGEPVSGFEAERLRGLTRAAFLQLVGERPFGRLRDEGLRVVAPGDDGRWRRVDLTAPAEDSLAACAWTDGALDHTPAGRLDPLLAGFARLTAELTTTPSDLERLGWRTRGGGEGSVRGRVDERGGRRVAEFDLGGSLAWRLAGNVRSLVVEDGKRPIERGEVLASPPPLEVGGGPEVEGPDWVFPASGAEPGARLVLGLLAHADWEHLELVLEQGPEGGLVARGAHAFVQRKTQGGEPVGWCLDYRIGERTLRRARGEVPRIP